jgi:fluoride ion exporter CrcB/FEX
MAPPPPCGLHRTARHPGVIYGVERQSARPEAQQLCSLFRCYFLNVFTSFPFVAVHAAEMCVLNGPLMGLGYILTSLALAIAAFELGRRPTEGTLAEARFNPMHWTTRLGSQDSRDRMLAGLFAIVLLSLLKSKYLLAVTVATGKDTTAESAHTFDTLVGIVLAICGAAVGGQIKSCMRANFLACAFVGAAFATRRLLRWDNVANTMWTIVFTKFVGSFCGATSGFARMLSDSGKLMHHEMKPQTALIEFVGHVGIAVVWAAVFYAFDRHGLDVYSHAFEYQPLHPVDLVQS